MICYRERKTPSKDKPFNIYLLTYLFIYLFIRLWFRKNSEQAYYFLWKNDSILSRFHIVLRLLGPYVWSKLTSQLS